MSDDKKVRRRFRLPGFWRSYSFVLTLICLCSLLVVCASADSWRIINGQLQTKQFGSWVNYSMGNASTTYPDYQYNAAFQQIAEDVGISGQASGGLTQAELESSLADYVGQRISSYSFAGAENKLVSDTVRDLYDAIAKNQIYSVMPLYSTYSGDYLDASGSVSSGVPSDGSISSLLRRGFAGLSRNLVGSGGPVSVTLFSGSSHSQNYLFNNILNLFGLFAQGNHSLLNTVCYHLNRIYSLDNSYFPQFKAALIGSGSAPVTYWDSSTKQEETVTYSNLLSAIVGLGTSIQNDLAKLRYVLASDQDIEIAEKQEAVKGSVADNFAGDGAAAVKPSDVGDMAIFSGDFQDTLSTGVNPAEAFSIVSDGNSWSFWSQDVAGDLDRVPAVASDDDDDFIHFYDPSVLDAYLSGGD